MISRQIIERLINADVVVADLSGHNPNVFYELAMRHAFTKPSILLYDPALPLPFDVKDLRAIPVTTDIRDASIARDLLAAMLAEVVGNERLFSETPFTAGIDLAAMLAATGVTPDNVGAKMAREIEELRDEMALLRADLERSKRSRRVLPQTAAAPKEPVPTLFPVGSRVQHRTFGVGTVVRCAALENGDYDISVAFQGQGVKRLLQSMAHLTPAPPTSSPY